MTKHTLKQHALCHALGIKRATILANVAAWRQQKRHHQPPAKSFNSLGDVLSEAMIKSHGQNHKTI